MLDVPISAKATRVSEEVSILGRLVSDLWIGINNQFCVKANVPVAIM